MIGCGRFVDICGVVAHSFGSLASSRISGSRSAQQINDALFFSSPPDILTDRSSIMLFIPRPSPIHI